MAEANLHGQHAVLVGDADRILLDAAAEALASQGATVQAVARTGIATLDRMDVCVYFARPGSGAGLRNGDRSAWDRELERALIDPARSVIEAARVMASGGGSIVIVGTVDACHAYAGRSVASVAMGGLLGLVRSIAVELSRDKVRANVVIAGPLGQADGSPPDGTDLASLDRTLLRSPMHRLGQVGEVAAAICFLAGSDSEFMTGQTIRVDGGWASLNQAPDGMRFS